MTVIAVDFKQEPEDDEPEPLRMEHFYLPLGMWCVGILISIFCFVAEIIKNWIKKWKAERLSDTEKAEVDKARVAFQQEVQHNTDDIEDTEDTEET